ncbi:MAG TPA: rod shape-determining protein MreC [Caulobacteraceae bacterium]|nr:rod shape-determining protein MreC [Caulobacteraceae bacterium]
MSLRDGPFQDLKVPLTWTAAVAVIVAMVIGLALLFGDHRGTMQAQAIGASRGALDTVLRPVESVIATPVRWVGDGVNGVRQYFFAVSENRRLRAEVAELSQWRDRAVALKDDNARYQSLLGLKTDPPIPMVGARVIADARGPFANTRLADAGTEAGVAVGNPVMTEHGLVGSILGVAHGVSRILLLTDVASRAPVLDDRTNSRAILTGDGSGQPLLAYLRGVDPVKPGDRILTSGDGGLYPRGLPVGTVVQGLDGNWRVRLDSDDGPIDLVRILLFRDFSQLAEQKALSAPVIPPLPPSEAADVAARAAPPPPVAAASAKPLSSPKPSASTPVAASSAKPAKAPKGKAAAAEPGKPPLAAKPARKATPAKSAADSGPPPAKAARPAKAKTEPAATKPAAVKPKPKPVPPPPAPEAPVPMP